MQLNRLAAGYLFLHIIHLQKITDVHRSLHIDPV